ncbi:MAG: HU family DNA-binding protein [Gemmatimonadota bacterium]
MIFDTISGSIDHEQRFSYPGFGTFTVKHRKAREGRNTTTEKNDGAGEENGDSDTTSPMIEFEPAPALKDVLN